MIIVFEPCAFCGNTIQPDEDFKLAKVGIVPVPKTCCAACYEFLFEGSDEEIISNPVIVHYACYFCRQESDMKFGARPNTLPRCYKWPGEEGFIDMPLRCECGEIQNVVQLK